MLASFPTTPCLNYHASSETDARSRGFVRPPDVFKSKTPPWFRGIRRSALQMANASLVRIPSSDAVAFLVTDHSFETYSVYDRHVFSMLGGLLSFKPDTVTVSCHRLISCPSSFGASLVWLFGSIRCRLSLLDGSVGYGFIGGLFCSRSNERLALTTRRSLVGEVFRIRRVG